MENEVTLNFLIKKYESVPYVDRDTIIKELKADFEKNFVGTVSQLKKEEIALKEKANMLFKKRYDEYNEKRNNVEEEIKDFMFNECRITDRDIFEKVYAMAYQDGHSAGFSEINGKLYDYDYLVYDCLEIYKAKIGK